MTGSSATLLSFPHTRAHIGAALRRHRLPESLSAHLTRESERLADTDATAALAHVLDQRIRPVPLDLGRTRAILLIGPVGSGKSTVATRIIRAAHRMGRKAEHISTTGALASLHTLMPDMLTVIEAMGFNPLNARAAAAFSALGEKPDVEVVGVVSALSDAEDISDMVRSFHFRRVIVTGLDQTHRLGALVAAITAGATLAHVSASPDPDAELQTLGAARLAGLLLDPLPH